MIFLPRMISATFSIDVVVLVVVAQLLHGNGLFSHIHELLKILCSLMRWCTRAAFFWKHFTHVSVSFNKIEHNFRALRDVSQSIFGSLKFLVIVSIFCCTLCSTLGFSLTNCKLSGSDKFFLICMMFAYWWLSEDWVGLA